MPIDYKLYPKNWLSELRPMILKRAANRCEHCGVQNHLKGYRQKDGTFIPFATIEAALEAEGYDYFEKELIHCWQNPPIKIILTIAHLNQNIADNRLENLAALCQRCHLNHDRNDNIYRRRFGKRYTEGLLFDATTFNSLKIN